jgi:cyclophilin family peptidyl-prolyl cis-trans isomerase
MVRNQRVYLDFRIGDSDTPHRLVFELYSSQYPRLCENFRGLCTGEFGRGRDTNCRLHYVGTKIHKLISGEVFHAGELAGGSESVYGGGIIMDPPVDTTATSQPGLLMMATSSTSNLARSQFIISLGKSSFSKSKNAIFGRLITGNDVLKTINSIPVDVTDKPRVDIVVVASGELKAGKNDIRSEEVVAEDVGEPEAICVPANVSPSMERRLLELRLKMNKAKQLNSQAVLEEKKRIEDPKSYMKAATSGHKGQEETRTDKASWYSHETVDGAQRRGMLNERDGDDASAAAHEKRVREMGFYPDAYVKQKEAIGANAFYGTNSFVPHKPSEEAKDRLVDSLKRDQDKRGKFSRKRIHDDDAGDVEWINDRNKQYTKKLDKAYGQSTAEIKGNIERGTAL